MSLSKNTLSGKNHSLRKTHRNMIKRTKHRKTKQSKRKQSKRKHTKKGNKVIKKSRVKHNKKGRRKTKRVQRGGNGSSSCPLVGKQWNGVSGGNFYKLNTPIGVGSTPVYPGNNLGLTQHTSSQGPVNGFNLHSNLANNAGQIGGSALHPLLPSPFLNAYRGSIGGIQNLWREYQGLHPLPSPEPWSQHQQQFK